MFAKSFKWLNQMFAKELNNSRITENKKLIL